MNDVYSVYHYYMKTKKNKEAIDEVAPKVIEAADKAVFGNIGDIKYTARTTVPNGGEWCDGSTYVKSRYPDVYNMLASGQLQCVDIETYENVVSLNGSCGFFGLDVKSESFKVPMLDEVYIKAGQEGGMFGSESLPNITGSLTNLIPYVYGEIKADGCFDAEHIGNTSLDSYGSTKYYRVTMDSSKSSETYQDGAKVNPDHVKYRAYIILYTGKDISFDKKEEYKLNNPFSLFDTKWSDHELNNTSWVVSNGGYISGAIYSSAYNELVSEYNKGEEKTDESITYKLTPKGYKIALADQESSIDELYNNEGVAWYYIIDTSTVKFKLPRTKYGFVGFRNGAGGYVAESLPNITGTVDGGQLMRTDVGGSQSGALYRFNSSNGSRPKGEGGSTFGIGLDASLSSSTYQDNAPVQQRATEMYLYFYVGETVQDANVINAGIVLAEISKKVNRDEADYVVESYRSGTNWYRVYKSGWVEQGGYCENSATVTFLKPFSDSNYTLVGGLIPGTESSSYEHLNLKSQTSTGFVYSAYDYYKLKWFACGY